MSRRATQDKWIIVESSDKTWPTGGENAKPPQCSGCKNAMNCIKRQRDKTPKDEPLRSEGVQYATGEE